MTNEKQSNRERITKEIISSLKIKLSEKNKRSLRKVVNATGVIIHTNLGRSLLCDSAIDAIIEVARSYSTLEYELSTGERGERYKHCTNLLKEITGAESALVVNNNASAVTLALNTLSFGKEAIISRGQLVEIGGSFRMPDVMAKSGAIMKDIGTTNKTHLKDYINAISDKTAVLLRVHTSNFRVLGFTAEVSLEELVELGKKYNLPVIDDLGSGALIDLSKYGLEKEPTVQEVVSAGVDVVTFSGDKLLGGPQAGIILGKKDIIEKMKKNPLTRAMRVDKFTLAGLEMTLREYLNEESAIKNIPTLRMLLTPLSEIEGNAIKLKDIINKSVSSIKYPIFASLVKGSSQVGGGALPLQDLPTILVAITSEKFSAVDIERHLRNNEPPIIARIQQNQVLLDPRTIQDGEDEIIAKALSEIKN